MVRLPDAVVPLLGADPVIVTAESLRRVVGLAEGSQVDWKREIGRGQSAASELSRDVAAFANASGGLIAIGISEGEGKVAEEIVGVAAEPGFDLPAWIESVVHSQISPRPHVSVHRVDLGADREVILVVVEAGDYAPYAQSDGSKLAYPVRGFEQKHYLSEAEVSDWYARRFRRVSRQDEEVEQLRLSSLPLLPLALTDPPVAVVLVVLVPSRPGLERLRAGTIEHYQQLLRSHAVIGLPGDNRSPLWNPRVGHNCVELSQGQVGPFGRLMMDGSGVLGFGMTGVDTKVALPQVMVARDLTRLLSVLSLHARDRGAAGTASLAVQVVANGQIEVWMNQGRPDTTSFGNPVRLPGASPISYRSVPLEGLASDVTALLTAVHMLGADLSSAYALEDIDGITPEGALESSWFPQAERWAEARGVIVQ